MYVSILTYALVFDVQERSTLLLHVSFLLLVSSHDIIHHELGGLPGSLFCVGLITQFKWTSFDPNISVAPLVILVHHHMKSIPG